MLLEHTARDESVHGKFLKKKSGRYNINDTCSTDPELRWPNEGCFVGILKKRVTYDDLSLGQFASGQINNILEVSDPRVAKAMLLQLSETINSAENLSWHIAKGAYACNMHNLEEGRLSWLDEAQWGYKRLSYSQSLMISSTQQAQHSSFVTSGNGKQKVPCKYFNKGQCSNLTDHEGTSVHYVHTCAHCYKFNRKISPHPEVKCFKLNGRPAATQ